MIYKVLAGAFLTSLGGLAYSGAIPVAKMLGQAPAGDFVHQVPATPDQVATALSDINFREVALANPTAGIVTMDRPRTADGTTTWSIRVNGQNVLEFVATLEPMEGGRATRVVAFARHGPDFAEAEVTSGFTELTGMRGILMAALEFELNSLAPPETRLSQDENERRRERRFTQAFTAQVMRNPTGMMSDAIEAQRQYEDMAADAEDAVHRQRQARRGWGSGQDGGSESWGHQGSIPGRPATDLRQYR